MKQIIFLISICLFSFYSVFSCSLSRGKLDKFDKAEFIFIGKVIGYTKKVHSASLMTPAYGLKIKSKEFVYLPKKTKSYYEVFPINLWADCSDGGTHINELKDDFPIGSEVRVIAKESKLLPKLTNGNIRLEDSPRELGSIILNSAEEKKFLSSKTNFFDYRTVSSLEKEDNGSKYAYLSNFELRKDLLKLQKSQSQKDKSNQLKRLLDISLCCVSLYRDANLYSIFKIYSANIQEFTYLWETHLSETSPEIFEQYKIIQYVENDLIKRGYKAIPINRAIRQSLSESMKIEKSKLLERCLQILSNNKKTKN